MKVNQAVSNHKYWIFTSIAIIIVLLLMWTVKMSWNSFNWRSLRCIIGQKFWQYEALTTFIFSFSIKLEATKGKKKDKLIV